MATAYAQKDTEADMELIKHNSQYVWGQGSGETLEAADKRAIRDLISQISVNVDAVTTDTVINKQDGSSALQSIFPTIL